MSSVPNHIKEITKLFEQQRYHHDVFTVFTDCVAAMALAISNSADLAQRDERERLYMEIVGRYDRGVIESFPKVMAHIVMAFEEGMQDVLGQVFNELELHNKARGQYFTPYELCKATASVMVDDRLKTLVEEKGHVTLLEPACGSGAMAIAFAEVMAQQGLNWQTQLHVTAVDIDPRAAHMTYVQLSLLNIPAEVFVGNSLTGDMRERWWTPAHILGGWSFRLDRRGEVKPVGQEQKTADVELSASYEQPSMFDVLGS